MLKGVIHSDHARYLIFSVIVCYIFLVVYVNRIYFWFCRKNLQNMKSRHQHIANVTRSLPTLLITDDRVAIHGWMRVVFIPIPTLSGKLPKLMTLFLNILPCRPLHPHIAWTCIYSKWGSVNVDYQWRIPNACSRNSNWKIFFCTQFSSIF